MNLLDQKICIVGMGYVGLPLAVCFEEDLRQLVMTLKIKGFLI